MQVNIDQPTRRCERRARFIDYKRTGSADLRDRLVRRNLPFARSLARRFMARGVPLDDLFQVAAIGLVKAVDRFDPHRGIPFEIFASPTIVGELKHHFRDVGWDVRVGRRLSDLHAQVNTTVDRLTTRLGHSPTVTEIAQVLGTSVEEVMAAVEAGSAFNASSLSVDNDDDGALDAAVSSEDTAIPFLETRLLIADLLDELPRREQLIVRMHYWDRLSQDAIASRLGISQMHVSRLLRRSVATLRETLGASLEGSTDV